MNIALWLSSVAVTYPWMKSVFSEQNNNKLMTIFLLFCSVNKLSHSIDSPNIFRKGCFNRILLLYDIPVICKLIC